MAFQMLENQTSGWSTEIEASHATVTFNFEGAIVGCE
jgi:hypothetical protein